MNHRRGCPSAEDHEVAFGHSGDAGFVSPGVPERVRVGAGYAGLVASSVDHLCDAAGRELPAESEPHRSEGVLQNWRGRSSMVRAGDS